MASQWIKFDHFTPDKPEVDAMANALKIDPDTVVGKLIRFWIWADQQSISGNGLNVTKTFIDRITYCEGFTNALISVGWIVEVPGGFSIPNFDRHNGESAKSRATTQKRVKKHRETGNGNVTDKPLPEKRREEKSFNSPLPPTTSFGTLWDASIDCFGKPTTYPEEQRARQGVEELVRIGATPEDLRLRVENYRKGWPNMPCTLKAILKNWNTTANLKGENNGTAKQRADSTATDRIMAGMAGLVQGRSRQALLARGENAPG